MTEDQWKRYEELRGIVLGVAEAVIVDTPEKSAEYGERIGTAVWVRHPPTRIATMDEMLEFQWLRP